MSDSTRPILVILTEGFADWETGLLALASFESGVPALRHACPGGGDVTSLGGLRVSGLPDVQIGPDDVVVLCGGAIWGTPEAPDLGPALRAAHRNGQPIAAICGATLALGRAGLLDEAAHTSNGADYVDHYLPGYAGRARYVDSAKAVADRGIITASGAAPTSFAIEVLRAAGLPDDRLAEFAQMLHAETA